MFFSANRVELAGDKKHPLYESKTISRGERICMAFTGDKTPASIVL